ncbi:MAG: HPr family phosphocarrier protein [Calditerrivibrio sp.]|nr:HPr family phosphocarrier protein [Calditerrivibrio sp.]MCA1932469.1 HPr family phosphocarrier protein [Calditerrivibrio sp.]MCA1981215.1 HPr family phosphocarrier protein [Calditerrivibrio sp.]
MNTVTTDVTIINELGLHARAAALFVKTASKYRSEIILSKGSLTANGKSIMGVMMLAAPKGSVITLKCTGDDAEDAINELKVLIENRFGEDR